MARLQPRRKTVKELFAKCGNTCAYKNCKVKMVEDSGLVNAEICHIEAANEGGPRFNPKSNDEYRRSAENLLLLCANHHNRVDNSPQSYSVTFLKKLKQDHEFSYESNSDLEVDETVVDQVIDSMINYISGQAVIVKGNVEGDVIVTTNEISDDLNNTKENDSNKWRSSLKDISLILGLILTMITLYKIFYSHDTQIIDNSLIRINQFDFNLENNLMSFELEVGLINHGNTEIRLEELSFEVVSYDSLDKEIAEYHYQSEVNEDVGIKENYVKKLSSKTAALWIGYNDQLANLSAYQLLKLSTTFKGYVSYKLTGGNGKRVSGKINDLTFNEEFKLKPITISVIPSQTTDTTIIIDNINSLDSTRFFKYERLDESQEVNFK